MIELTNLVKRYGDITALEGISLKIEKGEMFGLLGPNGAGKSTSINLISGALKPDAGEIHLNDGASWYHRWEGVVNLGWGMGKKSESGGIREGKQKLR